MNISGGKVRLAGGDVAIYPFAIVAYTFVKQEYSVPCVGLEGFCPFLRYPWELDVESYYLAS